MSQPELDPMLVDAILQLLLKHPQGISEHALLKALAEQGWQHFAPNLEPLAMFQAHFLLFHILYRQQTHWAQQGHGQLDIHCLAIQFKQPDLNRLTQPRPDQSPPDIADPIRSYYLDYRAYRETQTQDVIDLLDRFWQGFGQVFSSEQLTQAKLQLNISADEPLNLARINQQYRKLSAVHHPDRGGDTAKFQQISQAAEILRKSIKQGLS